MMAGLGLLCYCNTFNSPFAFDDGINIMDNSIVRDIRYFTGSAVFVLEDSTPDIHMLFMKSAFKVRYVGYLSFALNFKLNGLNVTGYHVFNLIVHISNAILLYLFVVLIFKTPFFAKYDFMHSNVLGIANAPRLQALAVALLFVCHPVQTQAVTYIVQRFASLATFFYLAAIVMYIKSRLVKSYAAKISIFAIALSMAILAMKTKEISFTLPVVITVFEFMFLDGSSKQRTIYLIPLLLTMSIIPIALIGENNSLMQLRDIDKAISIASSQDISRWDYLFTQFRVIVTYTRLLILPVNQNIDYDYPIYRSFFDPSVLLSFVFISSIIAGALLLYRLSKKSENHYNPYLRLISFAVLWFFVTLSVESSVVPIADVIFEHRLYLPSVGAFIAMITTTTLVLNSVTIRRPELKKFILPLALLTLTVLTIATYSRNSVWQNNFTLWSDAARKSPSKPRPNLQLAELYTDMGYIDDAIRQYHKTISLKPDYADAYMSISRLYAYLGRYEEAVSQARLGINYYKDTYRRYYKIGEASISFEDYFAIIHFSLGNTFVGWGRMDAALNEYLTAIELKPDYAQAYVSAGNVYATKGNYDEAVKKYQTALEIRPGFTDALQNLSFVKQKQGLTK
ncbi:MAG: tetratricopeptide repeat protein [Nitrospirae bacterium]|nr:tetratricopeptide repeat protein [Nitrospirota bacterium]